MQKKKCELRDQCFSSGPEYERIIAEHLDERVLQKCNELLRGFVTLKL
jgi:hypothetical protein